VSVQQTGSGDVAYNGVNYLRQDWAATISVDEVIKGEPLSHAFILNFSSPSTDAWGNVAQGGVPPNTYRVMAGFEGSGSGVTSLAGFAGARLPQAPGSRTPIPAAFK